MRKIKILTAIMTLALLMSLGAAQAFAGDMNFPVITGPQESPGVNGIIHTGAYGDMQNGIAGDIGSPGIAGDISTPGIAGEILLPGIWGIAYAFLS